MKLPVFNFGVKRGQGQKLPPIIREERPPSPGGDPSSANKARFQSEMNLQLAVRKMGLPMPFVLLTQTERDGEKGPSLNCRDCLAAPCVFELHYAGKIWRHYGRNIASLYTWMDFISLRHALPG